VTVSKKCTHCGSLNLDEELTCGACGGSLDAKSQSVGSVDPWINEGPHRTMRCQICRARVPADEMDDHNRTLHPIWASWVQRRKRFPLFLKVSGIIMGLLIALAILTGNFGYPIIFAALFISIVGLWANFDRTGRMRAKRRWELDNG